MKWQHKSTLIIQGTLIAETENSWHIRLTKGFTTPGFTYPAGDNIRLDKRLYDLITPQKKEIKNG